MSTDDFTLVRKVILTWVYNVLHAEYPIYFNTNDYINTSGAMVKNSPNVYWGDTLRDRPLDSTECVLDIVRDESYTFGTDGIFYQDEINNKYYYEINEPHEITVNFAITSMKNKSLNLSALQAQNLTYNACAYLRMLLKSGSASDYFRYENEIMDSPILVCSQPKNVSEIQDTSIFEDTRNRHTNQFSCKFRYDLHSRREVDVAQHIGYTLETNNEEITFEEAGDIEII